VFLTLILRLARYAAGERSPPSPTANQSHEEMIAAAVRTIDLDYGRKLRVCELAAAVHLSPDHFAAIFSKVTVMTPREYIRHVRLERAKTLLATTALRIAEIARATGANDHSTFTRRFRAPTGVSPRQFRRQASS
jgi:transcriptional regulator GlxA family with amidase domain